MGGVVFFDIGETLATARVSPPPHHLTGLSVYPYVPDVLHELKELPAGLGIISNTPGHSFEP